MDTVGPLGVRRAFAGPARQSPVPAGELAGTEAGAYHVTTGVAPDLREATKAATRAMIEHLGHTRGLDRQEAYALCSVACDLRIHEVVDQPNWVVGMFLPLGIFDEEGR